MRLPEQKTRKIKPFRLILCGAVIVGAFLLWQKIPFAQAQTTPPAPKQPLIAEPVWPENVAAAGVGVKNGGVLGVTGDEQSRPIASIAKVITSLVLLDKYPLKPGESGPSIPITEDDEQLYRDYIAQNGTVVLVKAGSPITLRQALEAMLLPSANNIADTSAIWGFGSLEEYHRYANEFLQRKGLTNTVVGGDASGLDPATKSTTRDLIKLGELALENPVTAEIVAQTSGSIAVAGPIPNYNALVTKHGFTGIKPGDTLEAGITSLFSTKRIIQGKEVTLIGVILGADTYRASNDGAVTIINSVTDSARLTAHN